MPRRRILWPPILTFLFCLSVTDSASVNSVVPSVTESCEISENVDVQENVEDNSIHNYFETEVQSTTDNIIGNILQETQSKDSQAVEIINAVVNDENYLVFDLGEKRLFPTVINQANQEVSEVVILTQPQIDLSTDFSETNVINKNQQVEESSTDGSASITKASVIKNQNDIKNRSEIEAEGGEGNLEEINIEIVQEKKRKKKSTLTLQEKLNLKQKKIKEDHPVHPPCTDRCKKKCTTKFSDERRIDVNKQFWNLSWTERRLFILHNATKNSVKRRTAGDASLRHYTFKYNLRDHNGLPHEVCKTFFLTTLGFTKHNDTVLHNVLAEDATQISPREDNRGKHPCNRKLDRDKIKQHIESFNPSISHYRREHAPHRRYFPSDVSIKIMHEDFNSKNAENQCSYPIYRSVVSEMKISFTNLGHEECEMCEEFSLHNPDHKQTTFDSCEQCIAWTKHRKRAEDARAHYQRDAQLNINGGNDVYFCADLQKVIMLPRMEMFKKIIFTKRLVVFNESFVPLGSLSGNNIPLAILWNEATAGRGKEDILSTFHQFFLSQRDAKNITIWLDNCSGQNKNWTLLTYLVYIVNSGEIAAETVTLKYFQAGHTFMAADSFHHQVELSLKRANKVYDFQDFVNCVKTCNSKNVIAKVMAYVDFSDWKDFSSTYKLKNTNPRPYLHDMVQIVAKKGSNALGYKNSFENEEITLEFLMKKFQSQIRQIPKPTVRSSNRGIPEDKKNDILKNFSSLIPENRLEFWRTLPVSPNVSDLSNNFE